MNHLGEFVKKASYDNLVIAVSAAILQATATHGAFIEKADFP
jgi:hypothetical protein